MPRAQHRPVLTPLPGAVTDLGLVDALAQLTFTVQAAIGRVAATYDLSIVQARLLGILPRPAAHHKGAGRLPAA